MKTKIVLIGLLCWIAKTNSDAQNSASYDIYNGGLWPNDNCAFGTGVMMGNPGAIDNTGTGYRALETGQALNENCANGAFSLRSTGSNPVSPGNGHTGVGFQSLYSNITGSGLSAIGSSALYSNTTGIENVANGVEALYSNTTGRRNTASGYQALYASPAGNNSTDNTAIGHSALRNVGNNGSQNTAVGKDALKLNNTGYSNSAMGYQALYSNSSFGLENTAIGYKAMWSNGNGGNQNLAIGYKALYSNTSGKFNIAIGQDAMLNNQTGKDNIGIGVNALQSNVTGDYNVAIGGSALQNCNGSYNVAAGTSALQNITPSGNTNLAIGAIAGESFQFSGSGNPNQYCSFFGAYSGITGTYDNASALGWFAAVNASDKIRLGDVNVTNVETQMAVTTVSDGRFKINVKEEGVKGLDFIMRLRPVVYNFDKIKYAKFITRNAADSIKQKYLQGIDQSIKDQRQSGFVAQEVEQAARESGYDFSAIVKPQNENDNYSLAYGGFVVPITKAVQEQQRLIEQQQQALEELQKSEANREKLFGELQKFQAGVGTHEPAISMDAVSDPANGQVTIRYELPKEQEQAVVTIYDLSGKAMESYPVTNGNSSLEIKSHKLQAGIYVYSIASNDRLLGTKTLVVLEK